MGRVDGEDVQDCDLCSVFTEGGGEEKVVWIGMLCNENDITGMPDYRVAP